MMWEELEDGTVEGNWPHQGVYSETESCFGPNLRRRGSARWHFPRDFSCDDGRHGRSLEVHQRRAKRGLYGSRPILSS